MSVFNYKKKFGQHFLTYVPQELFLQDENLSNIKKLTVVEIGPGTGSVTNPIAKKLSTQVSEVTEDSILNYLDTKGIPDPDLILRTSGEKRLSGILPYQSVYAELEFLDKAFPAMTKEDLTQIIEEYYNRQRRFGGS